MGIIFNFNTDQVQVYGDEYYALVETTGKDPKQAEAKLKYAPIKPATENHLVVSTGLAKGLGIEGRKDIKILNVYQKVEDVDLDKL